MRHVVSLIQNEDEIFVAVWDVGGSYQSLWSKERDCAIPCWAQVGAMV